MNIVKSLLSLFKKAAPPPGSLGGGVGLTTPFVDSYKKLREPTARELLKELKSVAWSCANINASVCASFPPKLYISTAPGQSTPRFKTKASARLRLSDSPLLTIEEVTEHPLLTLLQQVNPSHNEFDLWELTQLYMEATGIAYWLLDMNPVLGIPEHIWPLSTHLVTPRRNDGSDNLVDYYEYRTTSGRVARYDPKDMIVFRNPDPRDPYLSGLSPLRACYEQVAITSEYSSMKRAIYDNVGIPSVIISPDEVIGDEERDRLETQWNTKFRRGGMAKVLVAESKMGVQVLNHSMGDLAALADIKATKEDIANAFGVPLPYLSRETNLANMEASEILHTKLAIRPRLKRRDQKLNEQLIPLYDKTGRLFIASDDPVPEDVDRRNKQEAQDLTLGVRSINEVRAERGLPPVPWGDKPLANGQGRDVMAEGK